jgi:hypothetical protein
MKTDGLLPKNTTLQASKYLNNLIEQDHRRIKSRVNVMLGFKRFGHAAVTITCIELKHRSRKGRSISPTRVSKIQLRAQLGRRCFHLIEANNKTDCLSPVCTICRTTIHRCLGRRAFTEVCPNLPTFTRLQQ